MTTFISILLSSRFKLSKVKPSNGKPSKLKLAYLPTFSLLLVKANVNRLIHLKITVLSCVVVALSGCAGIPISSAYKMMTADPLEFHPQGVAVAIKRPELVQINTGDVVLGLKISSQDKSLRVTEEYFLEVENAPRITPSLSPWLTSGASATIADEASVNNKESNVLTVLKLSPTDVKRMRALQAKMRGYKQQGLDANFGFYVSVLRGCKNAVNIPSNVYLTMLLRLDLNRDYFLLYEDFNVGQADLSPLKNLADWDFCSPDLIQQSLQYKNNSKLKL